MAVDFQVVFPQEAVEVRSAQRIPGQNALDILGQDFTSVDEVLINEQVSPEFAVLSRTRLLAQIPAGVTGIVRSVAVTSRKLTITERSFLKFRVSNVPSKVTGILRLVQVFVKILFTTPGTDIFNRRLGAGGLKNIGRTFSKAESGGIISDFVVSVENTSRQIITMQGRQPSLPQDERLLAARVRSARFSANEAALLVGVEVTSQAGRAALANLTV